MEEIVMPQENEPTGDRDRSVRVITYASSNTSIKNRIILDWHLFSFLMEGEKVVSYASGTKTITPDSFFFLPYGNCLMSEKIARNGLYKSVLMFVSRKALNDFFKSYPIKSKNVQKPARPMEVEPMALPKDDYLRHFISSLELASAGGNPADEHIARLKLDELMMYLLRKDESLVGYFHSLCTEWDEDAELRKVVNVHIQSSITVEELAFLCNMSLSTFKRKFAKVFGDAPKQWFFKMRMQRAADLLKDQGLKASEIYEQLGYENLSSFVQAFKKFHGLTPKQFQLS